MITRGFVGFKYNKKAPRGWYNHFDSYPSGLGSEIVDKLMKHTPKELLGFFKRLKLVEQNEGGGDDFYKAHKTVFELDWSKDSAILQDGKDFYKDGIFCEWAYIFNFDNETLEVYKGFGETPTKGLEKWKYSPDYGDRIYYVNRITTAPFSIFRFDKELFLNRLEGSEN